MSVVDEIEEVEQTINPEAPDCDESDPGEHEDCEPLRHTVVDFGFAFQRKDGIFVQLVFCTRCGVVLFNELPPQAIVLPEGIKQ